MVQELAVVLDVLGVDLIAVRYPGPKLWLAYHFRRCLDIDYDVGHPTTYLIDDHACTARYQEQQGDLVAVWDCVWVVW